MCGKRMRICFTRMRPQDTFEENLSGRAYACITAEGGKDRAGLRYGRNFNNQCGEASCSQFPWKYDVASQRGIPTLR